MPAAANLNTAERMIRQALRDAGRLQVGQTPTPEVYADMQSRMYDIINTWQTQGLKLWLNVTQSITLIVNTTSYTLGPAGSIMALKPLRVLGGWIVSSDGNRRPATPISLTDYRGLSNLTTAGEVVSFVVEKQTNDLVLRVWPAPAVARTFEVLLQRQAVSPTELDDRVELPIEWYMALRWALADDAATGQPALIMDRCERKAREFRRLLEDWDVEDVATSFQPASGGGFRSRFR
jgi:hypothetical protein